MNANDCRGVRREIDNCELGQRLSEQTELHLAACAGCAQFRIEREQLRELVGSLRPVAAPPDFDLRLRARMARERENAARQPFIFRFALTTPAIAIAALLVLAFATLIWINQRNRPTENAAAKPEPETVKPNSPSPATEPAGVKDTNPDQKFVVRNAPSPKPRRQPLRDLPVNTAPLVSDYSTKGAGSVPLRSFRDGEVSLTAPSKPMVVTVQDANGATHKILLPPVSFGSQRFDSRTPVSMANRRDW